MRPLTVALFCAFGICACGIVDSGTPWRSGRFAVLWIDEIESAHLAYEIEPGTGLELVPACVVAAGANARYVVAQRITPMRASTFYVIDSASFKPSSETTRQVLGPFSKPEFQRLTEKMGLPPLTQALPDSACGAAA